MSYQGGKSLVYHYGAGRHPYVPDGLALVSQEEITDILEKHPEMQITQKILVRGATHVDIYQHDLLTDAQKEAWAKMPNYNSNIASITIPNEAYVANVVGGWYGVVLILSENKGVPGVPK